MPLAPRQARGGGGGGGGRGAPGLMPGDYTARLTVDGKTYSQTVAVKADPRGVPANASVDDFGDDNK